jgi:hypothetical protein
MSMSSAALTRFQLHSASARSMRSLSSARFSSSEVTREAGLSQPSGPTRRDGQRVGQLEVLGLELRSVGEHPGVEQCVLELTHVARPAVAHEALERGARHAPALTPIARGEDAEEVVDEHGDVVETLAQRGHTHLDHVSR